MTIRYWIAIFLFALIVSGCGSENSSTSDRAQAIDATAVQPGPIATEPSYVSLDDDLTAMIDDFNSNVGRIRQVYIVGPTCGICLRGMADMDQVLVADLQNDPRLHTQVLHVPALGAEERHVEPTIHLIEGPRVRHFWDGSGHSGLEFQKALKLPVYAWDVWLIYGPEARWEHGNSPPAANFWQHQLGGLGNEFGSKLDPEVFAAEVRSRMDQIDPATLKKQHRQFASTETRKGDIIRVEQPRGVAIEQHLLNRGGYHDLKKITAMTSKGTLTVGTQKFSMSTASNHQDRFERTIQTADGVAVSSVNGGVVSRTGPSLLPPEIEAAVLSAFEFDGWLMEWKDKGHQVRRLGMLRDGDRMPWLLEVEHRNGQTWHLYLDSHNGDIYRQVLLDDQGDPAFTMEFDEFRDVAGYRMAHSWVLSVGSEEIARASHSHLDLVVSEQADPTAVSH
jgi:hypothetical protein